MTWKEFKKGAIAAGAVGDIVVKILGGFTVVVAALSFAWPWFGGQINMITARRFGVEGYAFYEIAPRYEIVAKNKDKNNFNLPFTTTNMGNFFAPESRGRTYEEIEVGDIIQAGKDGGYLHEAADPHSPMIYLFRNGECAMVLDKTKQMPKQVGYDGGWLRVATAACGLFK